MMLFENTTYYEEYTFTPNFSYINGKKNQSAVDQLCFVHNDTLYKVPSIVFHNIIA